MSDTNQTDGSLAAKLEYFAERLNRVFSYFFFAVEFDDDEALTAEPSNDSRAWAVQTIGNACLHTTLMALRELDAFLTPSRCRLRPDDISVSDFELPERPSFLLKREREDLDKRIAHITLRGLESQGDGWDVQELTIKAVRQCLDFLRLVETRYGVSYFLLYTAAVVTRRMTQQILSCMEEFNRRGGEAG